MTLWTNPFSIFRDFMHNQQDNTTLPDDELLNSCWHKLIIISLCSTVAISTVSSPALMIGGFRGILCQINRSSNQHVIG